MVPDDINGGRDFGRYLYAVFWSISLSLGVGMDVYPETTLETAFTILVAVVGVFMWAFVVGGAARLCRDCPEVVPRFARRGYERPSTRAGATSKLSQMDASGNQLRQQQITIQHYMRYRQVPPMLRKQV